MTLIPLAEFQRLAGLSDHVLLHLLKTNQLPCQSNDNGELVVDVESFELEKLVRAIAERKQRFLAEGEKLIIEKLGRVIVENTESIFEEVLQRFNGERKLEK